MALLAKSSQIKSFVYTASALTLLYSTYVYYSKEDEKDKTNIPTPESAYPYIGHLLSLGNVPSNQIFKWHEKYGPIIRVKMGIQDWIFVADPILAHKIFSGFGMYTSARPYSTFTTKHYSFGGQGIVFSDTNKRWKQARTAVLSVLAPKNVEKYTASIEQEIEKMVERLIQSTLQNGDTDIYSILELNATNIVCSVCIGTTFKSTSDPDFIRMASNIKEGARLSGVDMDIPLFLPALKPLSHVLGLEKKMAHFVKVMSEPFVNRLISNAVVSDGPNMMKELKEDRYDFTDREMFLILLDLISAGVETVTATLYWLFAIVCNMPEIQDKIQAEIDTFTRSNKRLPCFTDRLEFPYITAVMKETMRFKSATPFGIPHTATKDISVDGYKIPNGSVLISSNEYMHTKSSFYKNGHIFDPERYTGDERLMFSAANGTVNERDHFNFGWGRRICPGSYLAEVELFYSIVKVFSKASVRPPTSFSEQPNLSDHVYRGITTLPKSYKIRIVERSDS